MAVAQSCFSTEWNLDSKHPHIFIPFTPPTDSLAVINHTDVIYTDTQTPHLLQKGQNTDVIYTDTQTPHLLQKGQNEEKKD